MSKTVPPGADARVSVLLESRSATPVDSIDLHLDGAEVVLLSPSRNQLRSERKIISLRARLSGGAVLTEGKHRFTSRFSIPKNAPCSYRGTRIDIRYTLRLHVAIPWWPDVDQSFLLHVAKPAASRPPRIPVATTTATGNRAFLEVSLEDTTFAPGDLIEGALAFGNLLGRRVRSVDLALVGVERVEHLGQTSVGESSRFGIWHVWRDLDAVDEGRELAFKFRTPALVPASFETDRSSLTWGFEVRADLGWGEELLHTTPVAIAHLDGPPPPGARRKTVGSHRWRNVWEEVGTRRGFALDPHELRLVAELGGARVLVWIDAGGSKDRALAAELRWPSFGLGMQIGRRRLALGEIDLEDATFGKRFLVRGRDAVQVRALLATPFRRALLHFDSAFVDDEHAEVRVASPAYDTSHLDPFLGHVVQLARQIDDAHERVPPPTPMVAMAPAWEAFALDLGGRLERGSMSIRGGRVEGAEVEIRTEFGPAPDPLRTVIGLVVDPPLAEPFDPTNQAALASSSPAVRELLRSLLAGAEALRVSERAIELEVGAPIEDPRTLRNALGDMLALAARLRGDKRAGPYR